jgi:hypothetical protein
MLLRKLLNAVHDFPELIPCLSIVLYICRLVAMFNLRAPTLREGRDRLWRVRPQARSATFSSVYRANRVACRRRSFNLLCLVSLASSDGARLRPCFGLLGDISSAPLANGLNILHIVLAQDISIATCLLWDCI